MYNECGSHVTCIYIYIYIYIYIRTQWIPNMAAMSPIYTYIYVYIYIYKCSPGPFWESVSEGCRGGCIRRCRGGCPASDGWLAGGWLAPGPCPYRNWCFLWLNGPPSGAYSSYMQKPFKKFKEFKKFKKLKKFKIASTRTGQPARLTDSQVPLREQIPVICKNPSKNSKNSKKSKKPKKL